MQARLRQSLETLRRGEALFRSRQIGKGLRPSLSES